MIHPTWKNLFGAGVTLDVLGKVRSGPNRNLASAALVHASLDLLRATRWKHVGPPKFLKTRDYFVWKFKYVSYLFLPTVDDTAFDSYETVRRRGATISVIVPTNHEMLVRDAFEKRYGKAKFTVSAIEDYMSWRVMWATLDEGWSYKKTVEWWLRKYNLFIRHRKLSSSLLIDLRSLSRVESQ